MQKDWCLWKVSKNLRVSNAGVVGGVGFLLCYFCFDGCDFWVDEEGDESEENEDEEEELRVSDESESEDVTDNQSLGGNEAQSVSRRLDCLGLLAARQYGL